MRKLEGILIDAGGVLCRLHEEGVCAAWEAKSGLPSEEIERHPLPALGGPNGRATAESDEE